MSENDDAPPVACTLTPEVAAEQSERVTSTLSDRYSGAEELDDGYALSFEGTEQTLEAVARFVATELQCCSFAEYVVETAPPYEETRLRITGPEGTKAMFGDGLVALLESASA